MKDTIYFRHDYDAQNDPKMINLRVEYGREGYGKFRAILEMMRADSDVLLRQSECNAIAFRLQCDRIETAKFLDFCVGIGLLLYDEKEKVYYSERLQSDVEYMRNRSKVGKTSAEARRKKRIKTGGEPQNVDDTMQSHCDGNAKKDKKGKDKKGKEKIKKENTATAVRSKAADKQSAGIVAVDDRRTYGAVQDGEIVPQTDADFGNKDVKTMISVIKLQCRALGFAYDKTKENRFARHLCTAKYYGEFAESIGMSRVELAVEVLNLSVLVGFRKGYATGPAKIYQNYSEIYNKAIQLQNEKGKQEPISAQKTF